MLYYKHAQESTGSWCLRVQSCAVNAEILRNPRLCLLSDQVGLNVSERTIFAKVKSSIYYILSNLIPVTNSEENESLELSCLNSWLSASVLVYLHFEFSANWCS